MAKLLYPKVDWNGLTVALDDGHGMKTAGKRTPFIKDLGRSIRENEFNRKVVAFLADILLDHGFRVLLTAPTDYDTPLKQRTDAANAYKADCLVSIHFNAMGWEFDYSSASGISVHIFNGWITSKTKHLAECVGGFLKQGTKQKYRGIVRNNFHMLREYNGPAILTENGFMDDPEEARLMLKTSFQKEVASEHAQGLCKFFNVSYHGVKGVADENKNWLELGDTGAKVLEHQKDLKVLGFYKDKLDGSFGPNMEKAVYAFQKDQGIKEDGLLGPNTEKHLDAAMSKYEAAQIEKSKEQKEAERMAENKKATGFTDVSQDHWAAEKIKTAQKLGLVNGYPDETFKPDKTMTRAEFAAGLVQAYETIQKGQSK
ncbi:N-acetylmuramoyl-L-alanine amidase [Halobacillus sp. BBL2006]|uniref:N-acetylmuramoyl-L-alanine amidase n=1 Tax=Halobacillus sp. BBL2006 TaxID=1543706 RepID=UPI00068CDC39|nr:N-acetylmuramoyl-L-alanine amidase [Halobacillus sp. BBL2006]